VLASVGATTTESGQDWWSKERFDSLHRGTNYVKGRV